MSRILEAVDLFCGAGGTSSGAEATGGVEVRYALNHNEIAIQTHSLNFRNCRHFTARLDQVHPREVKRIDILYASPECVDHSNAKGGRPLDDQSRCQANDVLKWAEYHRPSWIILENVREFMKWGPLGANNRPLKKYRGKLFESWLNTLRNTGYRVEYRLLNAADFGAATSRTRLFVIARKGNRRIEWPEPTHTENAGGELPGMGLPRWRAASEIIDWSLPCPSVFDRKKPLKDKTLSRIEMGLRKFVGPYVVRWDHHGSKGSCSKTARDPIGTLITKANHGIAIPYTVTFRRNESGRDIELPIGTITAGGTHHGLAMPYLVSVNHGDGGQKRDRTYALESSLQTLTTHRSFGVAIPFLSPYYGNSTAADVQSAVQTITTKGRHSLVVAICGDATLTYAMDSDAMKSLKATMRELGVADIGFRMLSNAELALAQGFSPTFQFAGNKADVTRQIGNSVSPIVAESITRACLSV